MLADGLVGTWRFVSMEGVREDGAQAHPFGRNLLGLLMFDGRGNMAVQLVGQDRAPFASDDPLASRAEEAKAAMDGSVVYFGTYEVDEDRRLLSTTVVGSLFPNWLGTVQRRHAQVEGDTLRLSADAQVLDGAWVVLRSTWHRLAGQPGTASR